MGDRVAVLKDGVLLQVDSANDLYEYPESVFVGEFIGSPKMNVQPGSLNTSGGVANIECLGVRTTLSAELTCRIEAAPPGGAVLVGIRPHDLHLAGRVRPGKWASAGTDRHRRAHRHRSLRHDRRGRRESDRAPAAHATAGARPERGARV